MVLSSDPEKPSPYPIPGKSPPNVGLCTHSSVRGGGRKLPCVARKGSSRATLSDRSAAGACALGSCLPVFVDERCCGNAPDESQETQPQHFHFCLSFVCFNRRVTACVFYHYRTEFARHLWFLFRSIQTLVCQHFRLSCSRPGACTRS